MFELVKEHFFESRKERNIIISSQNLVIGLIALIASSVFFLFTDYHWGAKSCTISNIWFSVSTFLAGASIFVGICIMVFMVLRRGKRQDVAKMNELIDYKDELEEYWSGNDQEVDVYEDLKRRMLRRYAEAADANSETNIDNLKYLHWTRVCVAVAVLFTLLMIPPYVHHRLKYADDQIPRSSHTSTPHALMNGNGDSGETDQAPQPPPNRETRDGDGPNETKDVSPSEANDSQ
jgi:uncharacterized membrane protein